MTSSFVIGTVASASFANQALSSSYATTASFATQASTASFVVGTVSSASFATQALSSSYALTASFLVGTIASASFATQALSSSYALTASFALNAGAQDVVSQSAQLTNGGGKAFNTSSNVTFGQITASAANITTVTASNFFSSGTTSFGNSAFDEHQFTGSVSMTGSFVLASNTTMVGTASYALTASFALNAGAQDVVSQSAQLTNGGGKAFNTS